MAQGTKGLVRKSHHRFEAGQDQAGLAGDCERYEAVTELRIHFGPGYRVYTVEDGPVLVVLLCGGDKSDQKKDFKQAKELADEYHKIKKSGSAKLRPLPD